MTKQGNKNITSLSFQGQNSKNRGMKWLILLSCCFVGLNAGFRKSTKKTKNPNVIVILADDLGFNLDIFINMFTLKLRL